MRYLDQVRKRNQEVLERVNRISQKIGEATRLDQILDAYGEEGVASLRFKLWPHRLICILWILLILIFPFLFLFILSAISTTLSQKFVQYIGSLGGVAWIIVVVMIILCFVAWKMCHRGALSQRIINDLIEKTKNKWLRLRHDVVFGDFSDEMSHSISEYNSDRKKPIQNIDGLRCIYPSFFDWGNDSNEIIHAISGCFKKGEAVVPYLVYRYKYVDEVTEMSSDGKSTTRRTYTYYRDGVFVSHLVYEDIDIHFGKGCYYPIQWEPSSLDFRKKFKVSGKNETALAKFFEPRNVLKIQAFFSDIKLTRATFNTDGFLMMDVPNNLFETANEFSMTHIKTTRDMLNCLPQYECRNLDAWQSNIVDYLVYFNRL